MRSGPAVENEVEADGEPDELGRFRRPLPMGSLRTGGSINEVGRRFQSFRISDLQMVEILPRWNPLMGWVRQIDRFRIAA